MKGRLIESMTWLEAEKALKSHRVIVTPVGARTKEHGPHLPLNNDWLMAEYLARRVLERCRVLVLPTVPYGYYPAFLEYPGSVSIDKATFRDTIVGICRSFAPHGARRHYILNTGISTLRPLADARTILKGEGIRMEYTDLLVALAEVEKNARVSEGGTHADEIETSMMLYMAPRIVKMRKAKKDFHPDKGGGLTRDPGARGTYSPTGVWGDPTLATRQKGKKVTEALVRHIVASLERLGR